MVKFIYQSYRVNVKVSCKKSSSWYGGWFDRVWSVLGLLWSAVCPWRYGGWFDRVWSVL